MGRRRAPPAERAQRLPLASDRAAPYPRRCRPREDSVGQTTRPARAHKQLLRQSVRLSRLLQTWPPAPSTASGYIKPNRRPLVQPPQRICNGEIDLPRIRRQDRGLQQAVRVVAPRPFEQALEFLEISVGGVVKPLIVAIKRGNAVNRFRSDGGRQLARENRLVAVD